MIHAIVHTQGVVLGRTYMPLELAYWDITNFRAHFIITSPINYYKMRRLYPHSRPDVMMITDGGTPYSEVLRFLRNRYLYLQQILAPRIVFGYKGESFQPQVLRDAGIPDRVNLEVYGVPPLKHENANGACPWHKGNRSKCALVALDRILWNR